MKNVCVEIDGVFYKSLSYAYRCLNQDWGVIKRRCLSNKFPNYKIVPYRVIYKKKKCKVCGKMRLLSNFYSSKISKDGFMYECIPCRSKSAKKHRGDNPEYSQEYYKQNKEEMDKKQKEWGRENPDHHKNYYQKNKKRINKYVKKRRKNIIIRLNHRMGNAINQSLKGEKNGAHWEDLAGWTVGKLIAHLESKFTEGMTWDNYGKGKYKWNIDHVIAVSKWSITSNICQALKDCWALDNLQPLWQVRNFEKGNKLMHPKYLIKPF